MLCSRLAESFQRSASHAHRGLTGTSLGRRIPRSCVAGESRAGSAETVSHRQGDDPVPDGPRQGQPRGHRATLLEGDRNDVALEAARAYPDRFAVMGRLAVQKPESRALVADWRMQPGMLGMRFTFHNEHYRHLLTDGSLDWFWPAAEKAGIPLMVLVPGALDQLDRIAGKHPGLKLVIDHVGISVRGKAPNVFDDLPKVCALAKHPN